MTFRHHTATLFLACSGALLLSACSGGDNPDNADTSSSAPAAGKAAPVIAPAVSSKLASYLGENICDALPVSALQQAFGAPADVQTSPSSFRGNHSCSYSWPRPDAEERQKAMMAEMMKNAQRPAGEKVKIDMRKLSTDFNVSVMLKESRATSANFVPVKLTEEQLQQRIQAATEAANKRLTEEQRKLIGKDGTEGIAGGMIRKTNERTEVDSIGDAAYWIPIMGGSLNVLDGGIHISITPMLADDEPGNIEAAKKVYGLLDR